MLNFISFRSFATWLLRVRNNNDYCANLASKMPKYRGDPRHCSPLKTVKFLYIFYYLWSVARNVSISNSNVNLQMQVVQILNFEYNRFW